MSAQLDLEFSPPYLSGQTWQRQLDALRSAVKHIGPKTVAGECDVGPTQLTDALAERDRKIWHPRWTAIVKILLVRENSEIALDLCRSIVDADLEHTPFVATAEAKLTPEDEALLLRRELAKFGDAGLNASARIGRGKR